MALDVSFQRSCGLATRKVVDHKSETNAIRGLHGSGSRTVDM